MSQIEIHWNEAEHLAQRLEQKQSQAQAEALEDFKSQYCDMFDIHDWMHYAHTTGKSIKYLRSIAKYHEEDEFKSAVYGLLGSELDADDLATFNF